MAVRDDFSAGEVLAAADLNDTFASKADYPSGGSNGDLLTKSGTSTAWATPSVAGLTLVTAESFTAVSSVNINGCFSATYENYQVLINFTSQSADATITARMRASGTDSTTQYVNMRTFDRSGGAGGFIGTVTNAIDLANHDGNVSNMSQAICLFFHLPYATEYTYVHGSGVRLGTDDNSYNDSFATRHKLETSYDGLSVLSSGGTVGGTIRIYGYKD